MWRDIRLAARSLGRAPGFTVSTVAILSVAIGAAIAIFTVVNATMLTPPPYPDSDRLVHFTSFDNGGPATDQELAFLRERSRTLSVIAAQRSTPGWNLVDGTRAVFVEALEVTDGYFEVHATPLLLGRGISPAEAQPDGPRVVVLSETLWRRLFGGTRDVLGKIVEVGGRPHEIVGVAPAHFRSVPSAQIWTSMPVFPQGTAASLRIFGRLAPGRSQHEAAAELNAMRADLRTLSPEQGDRTALITWLPHREWFAARSGELMWILLGAVAALLLVACVNVAGLQVARGLTRARELAARAALGASRMRLFREAFTESIILATMASAISLLLAAAGTEALLALLPPDLVADLLAGQSIAIDRTIVAAAILIGAVSAIVSGVAPALASAHVDLRTATTEASRVTTNRKAVWLRRGFSVVQIALALAMLVGAGLLIRTFGALRSAELGFAPAGILVGEMAIDDTRIDATARNLFIEQSLGGIRALPGVEAVTVASAVPVDRPFNMGVEALRAGRILERSNVDWTYVTPGYFDLFSIPLRTGRAFDARDDQAAAPVAVVNTAFARAFFGREDVIGETIRTRSFGDPARQIVGVVGDVRARSGSSFGSATVAVAAPAAPMMYVPLAQVPAGGFRMIHQFTPMRWVIRVRENAPGVAEAVAGAVRLVDPRRPFRRFLSMEQIVGRDIGLHRFLATLLALFAAIALALAAMGLYALVSQLVVQRRREIGIRLTLGATKGRVLRSFLTESLALTAAGLGLGLLVAPSLTRALESFLIGVTPLDAVTFIVVPVVLLGAAVAATWIPARRAARLDPAMSLRAE